jgi:hypothetical protein
LNRPEVFYYFGLLSGGAYASLDIKDKLRLKLILISCENKERPDAFKNNVNALKEAGFNAVSYISENTAHEFLACRRSFYQLPLL